MGDKWRQAQDKCEIMRAENHPECTGSQVGDKWRQGSCGQRIQTVVGDNWETSAKSCGQRIQCSGKNWETRGRQAEKSCEPEHSEHPECTGRENPERLWQETNVKSCGPSMHPFQRSKNPHR